MTQSGPVCGLHEKSAKGSVRAYMGIPYAASPAGENRWRAPQPVQPWSAPLQATAFGPACPQKHGKSAPYYQSEDCLHLNVWTPEKAHNLPVMVFLHGGAFVEGTASAKIYDGRNIAALGNVVVVSLNYRLGALGFLSGIDGLDGNYGFLDQQQALRWVRDNIARFGGNPHNVTLFGESAGAMSIGIHLISPESRPLFHAAILQSNPYGVPLRSIDMSNRAASNLRRDIGCAVEPSYQLECMRKAPLELILKYQLSAGSELEGLLTGMADMLQWAPVIDRRNIPGQPVEAQVDKPVIIGTNGMEGTAFAGLINEKLKHISERLYRSAINALLDDAAARAVLQNPTYAPRHGDNSLQFSELTTDFAFACAARHVLSRAKAPAYGYAFLHNTSFDVWPGLELCSLKDGSFAPCHMAELPFVFGNPYTVSTGRREQEQKFSPEERALSDNIIRYWTWFAAHHRMEGISPVWPRFPAVQVFDNKVETAPQGINSQCSFWDQFGYVQTGIFRDF
jgi:carboxylesterase type B